MVVSRLPQYGAWDCGERGAGEGVVECGAVDEQGGCEGLGCVGGEDSVEESVKLVLLKNMLYLETSNLSPLYHICDTG